MINLAPLALVGVPLVLAHRSFEPAEQRAPIARPDAAKAARLCLWAALFGASTGIVIAFGGGTPAFSMWFRGLENAHYAGGALGDASRRLALFFFGPIGGCTFAQFVMVAGLVAHDGATRRVAMAGAWSIAAWFAIDSGYGLAYSGLFNILMVNVPAFAVTFPPWVLLGRSASRV